MKTQNTQYRQGDVLIERVGSLPQKLANVKPENHRVPLAHGEVTGHAHSFADTEAEKLTDAKGAEFFRVTGRPLKAQLQIVRLWKDQVMVKHPTLGMIEFAIADVELAGDQVNVDGDFALLRHDEHTAHGIPAGLYRGGGAEQKVYQREYTPAAPVRVQD